MQVGIREDPRYPAPGLKWRRSATRPITAWSYGRSDPVPRRRVVDWVPVYLELAAELDLKSVPIIGWSAGGPSAMAVAASAPRCGRTWAVTNPTIRFSLPTGRRHGPRPWFTYPG